MLVHKSVESIKSKSQERADVGRKMVVRVVYMNPEGV